MSQLSILNQVINTFTNGLAASMPFVQLQQIAQDPLSLSQDTQDRIVDAILVEGNTVAQHLCIHTSHLTDSTYCIEIALNELVPEASDAATPILHPQDIRRLFLNSFSYDDVHISLWHADTDEFFCVNTSQVVGISPCKSRETVVRISTESEETFSMLCIQYGTKNARIRN